MKVFFVVVTSLDGYIARETGESTTAWASKEDMHLFVQLTKRAGVMVMGRKTFDTFKRALPERRNIVYSRTDIGVPGVETTQEAPADLVERLAAEGFSQVAVIGGGSVFEMFAKAGLVDELYLTIEPVVFGSGVKLCDTPLKLVLLDERKLNENTLSLHYRVIK